MCLPHVVGEERGLQFVLNLAAAGFLGIAQSPIVQALLDFAKVRMGDRPVIPEEDELRVVPKSLDLQAREDHSLVVEMGCENQQGDFDGVQAICYLFRQDHGHQLGHPEEVNLVMQGVFGVKRREGLHSVVRFLTDVDEVQGELLG
jgi:hypothetical protein